MLIGSGCGVPGIMASRTIESDRDRKMTIMTTTFIPCGAKMPIIGLIAAAVFGGSAWKSFNQKLKILYLMDVLLERTDEEHPITAKDMAQYLRGDGISVERKTIYDDIEALRIYGLDIRNRRGKVGGFYIANRKFQLPEVKFLMDAVQSSRFVTQKKSRELLRKLESLVVPEAAKKLREQLFIEPGNKTVNVIALPPYQLCLDLMRLL